MSASESVRLSPAHEAWLAENLLRGSPAAPLVALLVAQGVPEALARAEADAIARSPVFVGARRVLREGRQQSQIVGLQRAVAREAVPAPVVERRPLPSADEFFARYYGPGQPVVFPDAAADWPAVGKWTPAFFAEHYGAVEIEYVAGREADPLYDRHTPQLSRAGRLDAYLGLLEAAGETNDLYFVANNHNLERPAFDALWDDLRFPEGILNPARRQKTASLWIGPAGTVTPLHHDTCNVFFVQIHGRKRFHFAPPTETDLLTGAQAMYADADPEHPERTPDLAVPYATAEVGPGDVLFIPVGWWHHVRALSTSISVAMAGFTRPNWFDWYRPGSVG